MNQTQMNVVVRKESPESNDAQTLLDELDATLALFYGHRSGGRLLHEVSSARGTFLIIRTTDGFPIGCGALRRLDFATAEMKFLYTRAQNAGIAHALLARLEKDAVALGYCRLAIEADRANRRAIALCSRNGFEPAGSTPGVALNRLWFWKIVANGAT